MSTVLHAARLGAAALGTSVLLSLVAVGPASAAGNPSTTGQPSQTCGTSTAARTPGQSANAPGSAFNPTGTAGMVYAGSQPQNSHNTKSVSQYDVACFQVSRH